MKILITGNEGFVARNFIKYFGNKVDLLDGCDIKSGHDCRVLFKNNMNGNRYPRTYDLVIHLAAIVGGRETIENEPLSVATDLSIDAEMFNWAVKTKQPRVIYFSSSAAYPVSLQDNVFRKVLREEHIDFDNLGKPDYTYGWAKLTGEFLADYVNKTSDTKVYTFRPFSGYGADQDLTYPFPSFIKRIKDRVEAFEIWGDGTQARDFIHIEDVIQLVMNVVEADYRKPVNICTGIRTEFNDLAQMMFDISGYTPPKGIVHLLDKPVGVHNRIGDPFLMNQFHTPKYTLEERIEQILNG
jgi:nucleoside-diphosphate-sugar epimerase